MKVISREQSWVILFFIVQLPYRADGKTEVQRQEGTGGGRPWVVHQALLLAVKVAPPPPGVATQDTGTHWWMAGAFPPRLSLKEPVWSPSFNIT